MKDVLQQKAVNALPLANHRNNSSSLRSCLSANNLNCTVAPRQRRVNFMYDAWLPHLSRIFCHLCNCCCCCLCVLLSPLMFKLKSESMLQGRNESGRRCEDCDTVWANEVRRRCVRSVNCHMQIFGVLQTKVQQQEQAHQNQRRSGTAQHKWSRNANLLWHCKSSKRREAQTFCWAGLHAEWCVACNGWVGWQKVQVHGGGHRSKGMAARISCLFFTPITPSLRSAIGLGFCWLMWRIATPNRNISNVTGNVQHISDA